MREKRRTDDEVEELADLSLETEALSGHFWGWMWGKGLCEGEGGELEMRKLRGGGRGAYL